MTIWIRRLMMTLALSSTLAAGPAFASGPTDADLMSATTVGVTPILATGLSQEGAWARVAVAMTHGQRGLRGELPGSVAVDLGGDAGFGFAGHAGDEDIRVLRYGYYLGMVPALLASEHDDAASVIETLRDQLGALAGLEPAVVDAVRAALAGELDGAAFARVMQTAQAGLNAGDARQHGYLLAGMWTGLSTLATWNGQASDALLGMVDPLATLLEEDAAMGGADVRVARVMRRIGVELGKSAIDARQVMALCEELLAVERDGAAAPAVEVPMGGGASHALTR